MTFVALVMLRRNTRLARKAHVFGTRSVISSTNERRQPRTRVHPT
jgi:hypothetical protein